MNVDKDELEARIKAKTPRGWDGLSVGQGWYDIVDEVDKAITALFPDYEVHQIKQKFGGLRYYCSKSGNERVQEIIRAAEAKAALTCENCGNPGHDQPTGDGYGFYVRTLCDPCELKYQERRLKR
jgi:hypothetical protein